MVAKVIINNKEQNIDKTFDYSIPTSLEEKARVGMRVLVPFGKGNRTVDGIVIGVSENSEYKNLKNITKILGNEPVCQPWLLDLCLWVSEKYFCSLYQAIRLTTPPGMASGVHEKTMKTARLVVSRDEAFDAIDEMRKKGATARARVVEALLMAESLPLSKLVKEKGGSYDAVRSLEKLGVLAVEEVQLRRDAYNEEKYQKSSAYKPTDEQKVVIDHLYNAIDEEKNEKILLRGVTGSGKTEVFLQAIEKVIEKGTNAIMLVPEISLTPQMVERFVSRFGNQVAVIHSALSQGERFDEWNKIKNGEVKVVVGARSAIFAPFQNIGIIILDEEHENSYKSETTPRYHAIDVATKRAEDVFYCLPRRHHQ